MRKLREHQVVVVAHKMEAHNNNIINAPGIRILQVLNLRPSNDHFKKRKAKKSNP
jgi:hypothetical protein